MISLVVFISLCMIVAYLHKVAANFVYYLHEPTIKPLKDIGFMLINEIPPKYQVTSEVLFFIPIILMTVEILYGGCKWCWQGSNELSTQTYLMLYRFGMNVSVAALLRCISFLSTILPGPRYHCRKGSVHYNPPKNTYEIFTRSDMFNGCGDLIFSNHTTLHLIALLTLTTYEDMYQSAFAQALLYTIMVAFVVFTIASRKHYTVDIIIAMYVVPMVWCCSYQVVSDKWLLGLP